VSLGGARPNAGPKSPAKQTETPHSRKVQKIFAKMLFKKAFGGSKTVLEDIIEQYYKCTDPKEAKVLGDKVKIALEQVKFAAGTPPQMLPEKKEQKKDQRVLVLPEKESLDVWMAKRGQAAVVEKPKGEKPN